MLGMVLVCGTENGIVGKKDSFKRSFDQILCSDNHYKEVLNDNPSFVLGCTRYDEYPVATFETDEYYIYLEGKVYSEKAKTLKDCLVNIVQKLFTLSPEDGGHFLADWLTKTDGEYIVFACHKPSNRIIVFNDIFSRMPFYCCNDNGTVIISRDYHFVTSMIDDIKFDKMAIAQNLLYGFALGKRTHVENVERVSPATLIRIDLNNGNFSEDVVQVFNFDVKEHKNKSVKENARALASLYIEACQRRIDKDNPMLMSLSGGMDSRTIATSMTISGADLKCVSWLDFRKSAFLDNQIAEQISKILGQDWENYELTPGRASDVMTLLKMKNGLSTLGQPHSLQFFHRLKEKYGSGATLFSGNGGDRIARDIRPLMKIRNIDDAVRQIMTKDMPNLSGMPFEVVSALTGITRQAFVSELKKMLEDFPEKEPVQKTIHNNLYGQSYKWHHEEEDRKRFFFWATSPYWSYDLFNYWMNCPDSQKKNKRLYTTLISQLNLKVSEVPYADNKAVELTPIAKDKYAFWQLVRTIKKWPNPIRFIYKQIKKIGQPKGQAKKYEHSPLFVDCLKEQLENTPAIVQNLSEEALQGFISSIENYSARTLAVLFNVISSIEYISTDKSSIEKFLGSELDSYYLR